MRLSLLLSVAFFFSLDAFIRSQLSHTSSYKSTEISLTFTVTGFVYQGLQTL